MLFGFLLLCCNDTPAKIEVINEEVLDTDTLVLLFQAEQIGELWISGKNPEILKTFNWKGNYPLGALLLFADDDPLRRFQGKPCYVFPSRPAKDGSLPPCFACRHDIAEKYATLALVLKELKF